MALLSAVVISLTNILFVLFDLLGYLILLIISIIFFICGCVSTYFYYSLCFEGLID